MTPFGIYLEQLRRSRNLQQIQLADRLGIHPSHLCNIENGKKSPFGPDLLNKLADILDLEVNEYKDLTLYAKQSVTSLKVPSHIAAHEYAMIYEIWQRLGSLSKEQAEGITLFLTVGDNNKKEKLSRHIA